MIASHASHSGIATPSTRTAQRHVARALGKGVIYLSLTALAVVFLIPMFWMVSQSLMTHQETIQAPIVYAPRVPQWANYLNALRTVPLAHYFLNTLIIVAANVIGGTGSAMLCAYGFARLRFPGRGALFAVVLSTMMLPSAVTMIPLYVLFRQIGWINTFYPLTVPAFFGGGAFSIFLLRQFVRTIPRDLDEAARIDGATYWKIFSRIIVPLCKPALAVVGVTLFLAQWNDYLGPLIYLDSPDKFTYALGLANFQGPYGTGTELLMAASTMFVVPVILIFIFAQRYLIQGIVMTGLKG
jgi:multiple sugar transport system permease protein